MRVPPCDGMQSLFFPEDELRPETPVPLHLCETCPMRRECLVRGWKEQYGFWGGYSTEQRMIAHRRGVRPDDLT